MGLHIGRVDISEKILLDYLQLQDGELIDAELNEYRNLELTIVHPEMPELKPMYPIEKVNLNFTAEYKPGMEKIVTRNPICS